VSAATGKRELPLEEWVRGVRAGDRAVLGRAITLVESAHPEHRRQADALLAALLPHTGGAHRVGVTGVPGVGKSTFIEALGTHLTGAGRRVAVLAVDPSSATGGGSLLGDKTRMTWLGSDPRAFVRPSPAGGALGGVAARTREALLVCEAAGFDVVLVETVGVGQSEALVASMVDSFLLLLLAGAGDELQGIKRGVVELADVLAVTKADGENLERARAAAAEAQRALHYLRPRSATWRPPVLCVSALGGSAPEGTGVAAVWQRLEQHRARLEHSGELAARRREQQVSWLWDLVREGVLTCLRAHPAAAGAANELERAVAEGSTTPGQAAARLLDTFMSAGASAPERRDRGSP